MERVLVEEGQTGAGVGTDGQKRRWDHRSVLVEDAQVMTRSFWTAKRVLVTGGWLPRISRGGSIESAKLRTALDSTSNGV